MKPSQWGQIRPSFPGVTVIGMDGTVDAADVVKLAQKQQARIAATTK